MTEIEGGNRLDRLARTLARPRPRRAALVAGIAALTAGLMTRTGAQTTSGGFCIAQGLPCSMGATCCNGYCAPNSLYNPNVGICTSGTRPASTVATTPTPPPKVRTKYALKRIKVKLQCPDGSSNGLTPTRLGFASVSVLNNSTSYLTVNGITILGGGSAISTRTMPRTVYAKPPTDQQLILESQNPVANAIPTTTVETSVPTGGELTVELGSVAEGTSNGSFKFGILNYFWDVGDQDVFNGPKSDVGVRVTTSLGDLKAFCDQSKTQKYNKLKRKRTRRKNRR